MNEKPLTILWRGPLSGCNYNCHYCPFAKRTDSRATLAQDRAAVERFVRWVMARARPTAILFTPWGEALIRRQYQQAIARLSHAPQVTRVAIQTNLSARLGWLGESDTAKVGIWATWHPGEVTMERFVARIERLAHLGVSHSVGVVAVRAHFALIEELRAALPRGTYLWINAEESLQGKYTAAEVERLAAIDPYFELNNRAYASLGRSCGTGQSAISVDGEGNARRCHFVDTPLGNIFAPGFEERLAPSACPQATCSCHIGYSWLDDLGADHLFGENLLERRAMAPTRARALQALARYDGGGTLTADQAARSSIT